LTQTWHHWELLNQWLPDRLLDRLPGWLQVYKLMVPHWAYTLEINANARAALINAGGIIESVFTPGSYAMEVGSYE
jgi:hypothetical protein